MNNFPALRLGAALLVLLGHAHVLAGAAAPRWFGMEVHTLAVHVFFAISGYLICGSWLADPSVPRFAVRRALRIMPALACVVLLTAFVLGPAFTVLDLSAFLRHPETRLYLWNLLLAPYFTLPGVFADGRPFSAANGSLWSLPIEVAMYALVPLLALPGRAWRGVALPALVVLSVLAAVTFIALRPNQVQPVVYWSSLPFALRFASDFAVGAALRLWRLERVLSPQLALPLLAGLALLPAGGPALDAGRALCLLLVLPYAVLSLGLARPALLHHPALDRTDLSYGIYLWGGPVQQAALSLLGLELGAGRLFAVSLLGTLPLAWLSWHAVERPCLRLKPRRAAGPAPAA